MLAVSSTEAIVVGVTIALTPQTYVWCSFVVPTASKLSACLPRTQMALLRMANIQ